MNIAVVYFNSTCGVDRFDKIDYAFRSNLKVFIGEDEVDVDSAQELKDILDSKNVAVRTSQPSTSELVDVYNEALKDHDNVFVITPSKYLSGTHQNSILASSGFEEGKIRIIESKSFALSEYILIDRFITLRDKLGVDELEHTLVELAKRLQTFIVPGGFEFLKLSGRVSAPKALVASLLKVKVLIRHVEPDVADTKTDVAEVFYQGRGYNGIYKQIGNLLASDKIKNVYFGSIFEDLKLRDEFIKVAKENNIDVINTGIASQIMYAHIGPGSFGFALEFDE